LVCSNCCGSLWCAPDFTRLAAKRTGDGLGGFVVEASAALSILLYLAFLWLSGRWNQKFAALDRR